LHRLIAPALPGAFLYSITSSATESSDGGTVRPSIRAATAFDDQLEFARLYDRQVRRLLAFENPSHVDNYQAIHIRQAVAVSHQATVPSEAGL